MVSPPMTTSASAGPSRRSSSASRAAARSASAGATGRRRLGATRRCGPPRARLRDGPAELIHLAAGRDVQAPLTTVTVVASARSGSAAAHDRRPITAATAAATAPAGPAKSVEPDTADQAAASAATASSVSASATANAGPSPAAQASTAARSDSPATSPAPTRCSAGRLEVTGRRASRPAGPSATGTPSARTAPPRHTRPTAGNAGTTSTLGSPSAARRATSSSAQFPRSVESILCTWTRAGPRSSAARTRATASAGSRWREPRSRTTTAASGGGGPPTTPTGTGRPQRSAIMPAVSSAPVRSSARTSTNGSAALTRPGPAVGARLGPGHERLAGAPDDLAAPEGGGLAHELDVVAPGTQRVDGGRRHPGLDPDRPPLLPTPARRVERGLGVEQLVDRADHHLQVPCGCMKPPITPKGPTGSPSRVRKPGMIVCVRPLARGHHVRVRGVEREVGASVLHGDAGAGHDDARSEALVVALDEADHRAVAIAAHR